MLRQAPSMAVARLAAALVAVTLTGAPRVLALHAPAERHRCSCAAHAGGHHECDCAVCQKAALTAQASDESLPPCHRAAAQKALASAKGAGTRSAPCVEGTCGGGGRSALTVAGVEPFCLPAAPAVALPVPAAPVAGAVAPLLERARAPEPPPPRAG